MTKQALVVDDSKATRSLLRRILVSLDFEVHEAGDGQEALGQLARLDPMTLVLVDWNMPVMDGLDFIKAVRGDSSHERLVIMMVTSENDPASIARALMAGADEYAMKPLTRDMLLEKLELAGIETVGT